MAHSAHPQDAEIPLPRLRTISHLWCCAAVLAAAGGAALAIDVPLARAIQQGYCPGGVQKLLTVSEVFGHGWGMLLIVLTIYVLDPWHRFAIPRILAAALGSGLLANILKLMVARARPYSIALHGSGLDTFLQWFPLLGGSSARQGFPSSHTATAAGLAIVLSFYYPRGRWLFPALAMLAAGQRLIEQSHFLSDTFWGAAVGCMFAPLCVYGSGLARSLDRLEAWILTRQSASVLRGRHRATPVADLSSAPLSRRNSLY